MRNNWDFVAAKDVRFKGNVRGELKLEVLNITNTVKVTRPGRHRRQHDLRPDQHPVGLHAPDAADVPALVLEAGLGARGSGSRPRHDGEGRPSGPPFVCTDGIDRAAHDSARSRRFWAGVRRVLLAAARSSVARRRAGAAPRRVGGARAGRSIPRSAPAASARSRFPTAARAAAQDDFLRGVAWLHSFGYEDAIEAFRAAQAKDPGFAMAYWGEAMSFSQPLWFFEEPEQGRAALAQARRRPQRRASPRARTPRERGYLRAVEALWGAGRCGRRARRPSPTAMADAWPRRIPADDEAQVFYALALLGHDAARRRVAADSRAGRRASPRPSSRATRSTPAPRTSSCTPTTTARWRHAAWRRRAPTRRSRRRRATPSTCRRTSSCSSGYWHDAAASDRASWHASVAWVERGKRSVVQRDFHSLTWLQYELTQLGQFAEAQRIAAEVDAAAGGGHRPPTSSAAISTPTATSAAAAARWRCATTRARCARATSSRASAGARCAARAAFDNLDELFVVGRQRAAAAGRAAGAGRARRTAEGVGARDGRRAARAGDDPAARARSRGGGRRRPARRGRRRRWTKRRGCRTGCRSRSAGRIPVKGADELYGELLLRGWAGRRRPSAGSRRTLVRTPNRSRAVLGLARAAAKAGDAARSRAMYAQFLENWTDADPGLPELAEARPPCRRPTLVGQLLPGRAKSKAELSRDPDHRRGHCSVRTPIAA